MLSRICVRAGAGHARQLLCSAHTPAWLWQKQHCRRGLKGPLGSALSSLQKSSKTAEHLTGLSKTTCICEASLHCGQQQFQRCPQELHNWTRVKSASQCLRWPHTKGNADAKWKLLLQTPTMPTADDRTSALGTLLIAAPRRWVQNGVMPSVKVQNNQPAAGVDL